MCVFIFDAGVSEGQDVKNCACVVLFYPNCEIICVNRKTDINSHMKELYKAMLKNNHNV